MTEEGDAPLRAQGSGVADFSSGGSLKCATINVRTRACVALNCQALFSLRLEIGPATVFLGGPNSQREKFSSTYTRALPLQLRVPWRTSAAASWEPRAARPFGESSARSVVGSRALRSSVALGVVLSVAVALTLSTRAVARAAAAESRAAGAAAAGAAAGVAPLTELGSLKSAYCNLTIPKQAWAVSEPDAVAGVAAAAPADAVRDGRRLHRLLAVQAPHVELRRLRAPRAQRLERGRARRRASASTSCTRRRRPRAARARRRLSAVEAHFARRLDGMATYDAFMDFSLVLYVQVLDGYIVDFEGERRATTCCSSGRTTRTSARRRARASAATSSRCSCTCRARRS